MIKMYSSILFFIFTLILSTSYAVVQDFCVADYNAPANPEGYACKIPSNVTVDDFVYSGLGVPGSTSNMGKLGIASAFSSQLPGLNGLGLSMVRADLGVGGVVPLHTHRASEAILCLLPRARRGGLSGGCIGSTKATGSLYWFCNNPTTLSSCPFCY